MRVLIALFLVALLATATFAKGEDRLGSSSDPGIGCGAMTNLTNTYFSWASAYGLPWVMTCIAYIESRWDPTAYNPSGATGLWQIMQPLWCNSCDCSTLNTPDGNAQCANTILQSQGLAAWNPDPDTCVSWLKYGGAPFDCEELHVPERQEWARLDALLKPQAKKIKA